ncbi:MAG: DNA-binding protein [Desulfurococcales archaeon ex4484_204]|nr:MAG: DNA-binding protein [Desulfurococcales archaeon ex4484_204]
MSGSLRDVCKEGTAYVIDAAGFFASTPLNLVGRSLTVPEVIAEVKDLRSRLALQYLLSAGKLIVVEPPKDEVRYVASLSKNLGEFERLSKTDISLLALVSLLKKVCKRVVVVTDDHSVQNVALRIGAEVHGIKVPELRRYRRYVYVCPVCGYTSSKPGTCPKCGFKLIKKRAR